MREREGRGGQVGARRAAPALPQWSLREEEGGARGIVRRRSREGPRADGSYMAGARYWPLHWSMCHSRLQAASRRVEAPGGRIRTAPRGPRGAKGRVGARRGGGGEGLLRGICCTSPEGPGASLTRGARIGGRACPFARGPAEGHRHSHSRTGMGRCCGRAGVPSRGDAADYSADSDLTRTETQPTRI